MNRYLISGFEVTIKSKKMVVLVYFITLFFGLLAALPFKINLSSALGRFPETFKLLKGFDYTVYSDIMFKFGAMIKAHISLIFWFAIGFYFFWMILSGGIFYIFVKEGKFTMQKFVSGCCTYAWRFFRAGIYILMPQLLFIGSIFLSLSTLLESSLKTFESERALIYTLLSGVLLFIILYSFTRLVSDFAKVIIVHSESNRVLKSIWQAAKFVAAHLFSTYLLYTAIVVFQIIVYAAYFAFNSIIGSVSIPTLIIMFFIQQATVLFRIFGKVWLCASEVELYKEISEKS